MVFVKLNSGRLSNTIIVSGINALCLIIFFSIYRYSSSFNQLIGYSGGDSVLVNHFAQLSLSAFIFIILLLILVLYQYRGICFDLDKIQLSLCISMALLALVMLINYFLVDIPTLNVFPLSLITVANTLLAVQIVKNLAPLGAINTILVGAVSSLFRAFTIPAFEAASIPVALVVLIVMPLLLHLLLRKANALCRTTQSEAPANDRQYSVKYLRPVDSKTQRNMPVILFFHTSYHRLCRSIFSICHYLHSNS